MTTFAVIIGIVLAVALLGFIVGKFGWAISTQPQGTSWRGRIRHRRRPRPDAG